MGTRIYTLDNGLMVFLSINKDEPRIATRIAVRAGSTSDPEQTTGLAHYFEHMMFKGTSKIGALNWDEEKPLLDEISDLFEKHRDATDPEEKLNLYKKIDSLSTIAATYVAANEYDKMVSGIGAKGTNAGTSYDYTTFINDIPKNEFEKWLKLESERFSNIVLRLFHTELETVYEEYNMYQDMDRSRAQQVMMKTLFPNHPYGRQVIGLAKHLKNPSMKNIYQFAEKFYVSNNMVIALSGDLEFDETIQLIVKYFGDYQSKELPELTQPVEQPIEGPVIKEVYGPDAENISLAYRFDGDNSEDHKMVTMIDMILSNSQAGLIDLNLVQKQKVLRAGSSPFFMRDYGVQFLYGSPREGQSLDEVKDLLLSQIDMIKNGDFEDWMMEAIVNQMRLDEIYRTENNSSRVGTYVDIFVKEIPLAEKLGFINELEAITKNEIVKFANEKFQDNYVVVYKKVGQNTDAKKVEKPPLTPIPINREYQSAFYKEFTSVITEPIEPVFVDFKNEIDESVLAPGVDLYYINNKSNEIFRLNYIVDMGKNHNKKFPLAVDYLPYLGTDKYTAAELQQEFFKLGLSFGVNAGNERSYVFITGLSKSFEVAIELLEHVLANAKPDRQAYEDYVDGILKKRSDSKLSKNAILWGGMLNYGIYGKHSAFRDILTESELKNIDPSELTALLKEITSHEHMIYYYGPATMEVAVQQLKTHHFIPDELQPIPEPAVYKQLDNETNKVYFVDYDIKQANIVMISKGAGFNKELIPPAKLFGEYFGSGLSSILFQEIRESRALAYSAFASYSIPGKPDRNNILYGFVGTQADKLIDATDAMLELMNEMPKAEKQFNLAKESITKKINTERIIKDAIFWTFLSNKDRGIDYDIRRDVYKNMQTIGLAEFENNFFNQNIKGQKFTFLVQGNKEIINLKSLKRIGEVEELSLEEIFNY
jgi:predicted Zn-dependent peptidase